MHLLINKKGSSHWLATGVTRLQLDTVVFDLAGFSSVSSDPRMPPGSVGVDGEIPSKCPVLLLL